MYNMVPPVYRIPTIPKVKIDFKLNYINMNHVPNINSNNSCMNYLLFLIIRYTEVLTMKKKIQT